MAKCPGCGGEVAFPNKEWDLGPKLHIKLYKCKKCNKTFREYVKRR